MLALIPVECGEPSAGEPCLHRGLQRRFAVEPSGKSHFGELDPEARPELRGALDAWLAAAADAGSWIEWEQRKHERLLAA